MIPQQLTLDAGYWLVRLQRGEALTPDESRQAADALASVLSIAQTATAKAEALETIVETRRAADRERKRNRPRNSVESVESAESVDTPPSPPVSPPAPCTPTPPFNPPTPNSPSANADGAATSAAGGGRGGKAKRGGRKAGEPAPWMGEVARVWAEVFPGSAPPAGAATALRPAFAAHGPDVVLPRLAAYLRATSATYIRLDKFAATVMAPEWRPTGAAAVATGTPAERIAAVLLDADAVAVDPTTAQQRLTLAVHTGRVPREAALDAWQLLKTTGGTVPRDRDKAVRQVEALLAAAARRNGAHAATAGAA